MGPTLAGRHDDGKPSGKILDWLIYLLVFAVLVIGAVGVRDIVFMATGVSGQEVSTAEAVGGVFRPPFRGKRRVRILLMGADKRPGDKGRSDTLLVLTINPKTKRAAVLGIPRDLKVHIPDHGLDKINHSYHFGGLELTRECVQELLGEPIHYHVLMHFHGFAKIVDKLGGVWIDVPDIEGQDRGMNYDEGVRVMRTHIDHHGYLHVHLKPGLQKLDGAGALGFVRYRKSTMYRGGGDSDIARSGRQQQFLRAMAQQHLRVGNVDKLLAAASEMRDHITTDLAWNDIYDVLRVMKDVDPDEIWTGTVPVDDSWEGNPHIYYAILWENSFREMKAEMERHLDGLPIDLGEVEVLNASGTMGQANDAAQRLAEKGFPVKTVGNADTFDLEQTTILYADGHKADARVVASVLACGQLEEMDEQTADSFVDLRVMLGSDYGTAAAAAAAGDLPADTQ